MDNPALHRSGLQRRSTSAAWRSESDPLPLPLPFMRRLLACALAFAFILASVPDLHAGPPAPWPGKPIRFVVGFTPGGPSDLLARVVGERMSRRLKQPVVIDNRAGAGGNLAAESVAQSAADGHTWLLANNSILCSNAAIYPTPGFDAAKDFVPVGLIGTQSNVLVVRNGLPARDVAALVELAKRAPGRLNFASSGIGAAAHLAGELFRMRRDLDIVHIPYKGTQPALLDLVAGRVDMMFATSASALPLLRAGLVRALAVTAAARMPELPAVPTMKEAGLADFEAPTWHGLVVPAGTPAATVARLHRELEAVLDEPEVQALLRANAIEPAPGSTLAFARFIERETPKWEAAIRAARARLE